MARRRRRSRIREVLRALGLGALALLGQLACSADGAPLPEPPRFPEGVPAFALRQPEPPRLPLACKRANARWEAAAGLSVDCAAMPIQIGDAVPANMIDTLGEMPEGYIGATWPGHLVLIHPVVTERGQEALEALVLHELGHWHGGWDSAAHPEDGDATRAGAHYPTQINEGDLVWLCGFADCSRFEPELAPSGGCALR